MRFLGDGGYLQKNIIFNSYYGYDISQAMLDEAQKIYSKSGSIQWSSILPTKLYFDYSILSGIFNVRNDIPDIE